MPRETSPSFLDHRDMRGNIIKNGSFRQLKWWDQIHKSKTEDIFSITPKNNYVLLERTKSGNDGGTVGITQTIDVNVVRYRSLVLSLDAWIDFHTLLDTGFLAAKHGGMGELPLMVTIRYQDVQDHLQVWSYGFITETQKLKDTGNLTNVAFLKKCAWHHLDLDLMQDSIRRDSSGRLLPRPKKIIQINVSGKGWDFRSAIGNLKLSRRAVRSKPDPKQRAQDRSEGSGSPRSPEMKKPTPGKPGKPTPPPPPKPSPRRSKKSSSSKSREVPTQAPQAGKRPSQDSRKSTPPPAKPPTKARARKSPPKPSKESQRTAKAPSIQAPASQTKKSASSEPSPPPSSQQSKRPTDSELVPPSKQKLPDSFLYDRVYVDASNVAHGVDLKKPIVNNIILIHDKLWEMGFETIIVIADASLRHKIDDKKRFEELIDGGMISQAPAKTEADEFILGFAKQKIGYIITNDKMDEWRRKDPWVKENLDKVHIQFMIQEDMVQFVGFPR